MWKWIKRFFGLEEQEERKEVKDYCTIIYVAPDAELIGECRRAKEIMRVDERRELRRIEEAKAERYRQGQEWIANCNYLFGKKEVERPALRLVG